MATEGPPKDSANPLQRPHRAAHAGKGHDDALMAEGFVPRLVCACACAVLGFPLVLGARGRGYGARLRAGPWPLIPPCYVNTISSYRDPLNWIQIDGGYWLPLRFNGCEAAVDTMASLGLWGERRE